jgi:transposase
VEQLNLTDPGLEAVDPKPKVEAPLTAPRRFKPIERSQSELRIFAVDDLIDADHPARAIWNILQDLDLSGFEADVRSVEGRAGQSSFAPALLASLWLYGYSRGVGSARELSRWCGYEPGCQWLCGDNPVNYHTLSDFRVQHPEGLRKLLIDLLGVLTFKGLIKLERVAHDGTKVRAVASGESFHREATLQEHLAEAKAQVEALENETEENGSTERQKAAQRRAAEQRQQRLEEALEQIEQLRQSKTTAAQKTEVRVSETEAEARFMRMPDKSYAPAYSLQVSTDATAGMIVNADLTAQGSDFPQLLPALEQIQEDHGHMPDQVLADGGYMKREAMIALEGRTDLVGSYDEGQKNSEAQRVRQGIAEEFAVKLFVYDAAKNQFVCPEGKVLERCRSNSADGKIEHSYRAAKKDCEACAQQSKCCPKTKVRTVMRIEDEPAVMRFRQKMGTAKYKELYKERSRIAEFPFCWIKEKFGLRRFHVRGLAKAKMELWWVTLAYNIKQWIRIEREAAATA